MDGQLSPRTVEPSRVAGVMFVSDKAAHDASRSRKTKNLLTNMDTLICIATFAFVACYGILVWRSLPQQ